MEKRLVHGRHALLQSPGTRNMRVRLLVMMLILMVVGMSTVDLLLVHLKMEFDRAGIMHQRHRVEGSSGRCVIIAKSTAGKIPTNPLRCHNYIPEVGRNDRGRDMLSARANSKNIRVYPPSFPPEGAPTLAVANVQI